MTRFLCLFMNNNYNAVENTLFLRTINWKQKYICMIVYII